MKKRKLVVSIVVLTIFISIIAMSYNTNTQKTFTQDGVTYALTLDGASVSTIPSKGMYRVDVECNNATGKWLYDEWKLAVEDINGTNATCDISFNTISTTYLNDYITGLSGTVQGEGEVVDENNANIVYYETATTLTQSQYNNLSTYSSTWHDDTSGTTTTGTFTYSGNKWSSVPNTMSSGTFYHFSFFPQESGYYQVCYNIGTGNGGNRLYIYLNSTNITGGSGGWKNATDTIVVGCEDIGYITPDDNIKIVQRAYSSSLGGISTINFSLRRSNDVAESEVGVRYEGKNPNNYVLFNNELWRIIGVFDSSSHGINNQDLVKIIRNDTIEGLAWDKNGENDWTQSSLMNLLNGAYYNSTNGNGGEYCYGSSTTTSNNCNFVGSGISDDYRPMIEMVNWKLGGYHTSYVTTERFYGFERADTVYEGRPTSWTGYIGLMYPSDYGYSVLASSCPRTTLLINYESAICAGQSWLFIGVMDWMLTPNSNSSTGVYSLGYRGYLSGGGLSLGYSLRPVLYLDSSVYVYDGNGSISDPYIIGM